MRVPTCRYGRLRPPYAHRRSRGNRLRVRAAVGTRALAAIVPPPSIPPLVRPSPEPLPLDIPHSIPSSSRPPTPSSLILQRADAIPPRTLRTSLPCKAPTIAIRGPSFVAPTRGRAPAFPGHAPPPRRAAAEARRVATPASLLLDGARSCEDGGLRASQAIPTARLVTAPNFSGARPPRRRRAPGPRPAFVRTQRARPAAGPALPPAARPLAANPKAVSPTPPPFPRRCDLAWRHMRGFIELCLLPSPPSQASPRRLWTWRAPRAVQQRSRPRYSSSAPGPGAGSIPAACRPRKFSCLRHRSRVYYSTPFLTAARLRDARTRLTRPGRVTAREEGNVKRRRGARVAEGEAHGAP